MNRKLPFRLLLFAGSGLLLAGILLASGTIGIPLDRTLSSLFAAEPLPALTPAISFLSRLGSPPALLFTFLAIEMPLLYLGRKREPIFLLLSLGGSTILNSLLKSMIARPRPELRLVEIHSPSFPSWHSTASAALGLSIWFLFVSPMPRGACRRILSLACLGWPLLIGSSRLYLNVHWASDIVAGWGVGILVTLLAAYIVFTGKGKRYGAS
jgi:undecaprenyl-diphosphatase